MQKIPFEARDAIRFVFVTTDPVRDTPARLKEWLGSFDPSFIGLRGSVEEVNRILYALRMPAIQQSDAPAGSADYDVGHAAQVLAFGLDGVSRLEYPFGIRQEDWAHDLPKLARGELPAGATPVAPSSDSAPAQDAAGGNAADALPIRVAAAIVPQPATLTEAALYLVLRNNGGRGHAVRRLQRHRRARRAARDGARAREEWTTCRRGRRRSSAQGSRSSCSPAAAT